MREKTITLTRASGMPLRETERAQLRADMLFVGQPIYLRLREAATLQVYAADHYTIESIGPCSRWGGTRKTVVLKRRVMPATYQRGARAEAGAAHTEARRHGEDGRAE